MLFSKRRRSQNPYNERVPPRSRAPNGVRVYAIGDVHGRDDLLAELFEKIHLDIAGRSAARNHIVMLGDLIDRGPDSRGVMERLRQFSHHGCELHMLAGNHEEVLLRILDRELGILPGWLKFGGMETLKSYGADMIKIRRSDELTALDLVSSSIPRSHHIFLQSFHDTIRFGDYLFVHAGIRPSVALADQTRSDLRWIREPFLNDDSNHGFVVVHGHTISNEVVERENRIGIDTGAYVTGRLTALCLEGAERWFLEATSQQA